MNEIKPVLKLAAGLALLYLLSLRIGAAFAVFGYTPDCCWLLRTGQIICQTGGIPAAEPFSFALRVASQMNDPQPYIVYQWLSEVLFYYGYIHLDKIQLIAVTAGISAITFLVIPLRSCLRFPVSSLWLFSAIALESLTSNLRAFVRPEVLSDLLTALFLFLLQSIRLKHSQPNHTHIGWRTIGALTLAMIVATNLHVGFIVNLVLLLGYSLFFLLDDYLAKKATTATTKTLLIGTALCSLSTLANPYGVKLWLHIPRLLYGPLMENIVELQPLTLKTIRSDALYLPFVIFILFCYSTLAVSIFWKHRDQNFNFKSPIQLSSLVFLIAATFFSFHRARFISVGSLIMVFELTNFVAYAKGDDTRRNASGFWQKRSSFLAVELAIIAFTTIGVFQVANKVTHVSIPMMHSGFIPPFSGINFLRHHYDGERLFADAEIADMCEMYVPKCSIFEDTRFDGYDMIITSDFMRILRAEPHWQETLDGYKVEWIFVKPFTPIVKAISAGASWELVYNDPTCLIWRRRHLTHLLLP